MANLKRESYQEVQEVEQERDDLRLEKRMLEQRLEQQEEAIKRLKFGAQRNGDALESGMFGVVFWAGTQSCVRCRAGATDVPFLGTKTCSPPPYGSVHDAKTRPPVCSRMRGMACVAWLYSMTQFIWPSSSRTICLSPVGAFAERFGCVSHLLTI